MKTSQKGVEQIKSFEGFRTMPYKDVAGKLTVGYGHLIVPGDGCVEGSPITMGQATTLLVKDLATAEHCVDNLGVELTQNEFDALVCFTYNLGCGNLQKSALAKYLKEGDKEAAANEFPKWSMAGGKYVEALHKRRLAEQHCFQNNVYIA
jgi:GH24 family phage-related lysozyme (muramidase)